MKCYEIMKCLEELSPKSFAESWDNVGLLCGREEKEVSSIYIALDATKEVIEEAFGEYDEEDDARAAIANILEKKHYDPENADWRETRKAAAYLMRKGFEYGDIRRVMQIPEQNM